MIYGRVMCFPFDLFPRIQILGGIWAHSRSFQEKNAKLEIYQKEMEELTDFLIKEFFEK